MRIEESRGEVTDEIQEKGWREEEQQQHQQENDGIEEN